MKTLQNSYAVQFSHPLIFSSIALIITSLHDKKGKNCVDNCLAMLSEKAVCVSVCVIESVKDSDDIVENKMKMCVLYPISPLQCSSILHYSI